MKIIKNPIKRQEIIEIAKDQFGDLVKMVVDTEKNILAIGGDFHSEEELLLIEQENSKRQNLWGVNLYPQKIKNEQIEFDSVINLKPAFGNRSRGVESQTEQEKIRSIVEKLILD